MPNEKKFVLHEHHFLSNFSPSLKDQRAYSHIEFFPIHYWLELTYVEIVWERIISVRWSTKTRTMRWTSEENKNELSVCWKHLFCWRDRRPKKWWMKREIHYQLDRWWTPVVARWFSDPFLEIIRRIIISFGDSIVDIYSSLFWFHLLWESEYRTKENWKQKFTNENSREQCVDQVEVFDLKQTMIWNPEEIDEYFDL